MWSRWEKCISCSPVPNSFMGFVWPISGHRGREMPTIVGALGWGLQYSTLGSATCIQHSCRRKLVARICKTTPIFKFWLHNSYDYNLGQRFWQAHAVQLVWLSAVDLRAGALYGGVQMCGLQIVDSGSMLPYLIWSRYRFPLGHRFSYTFMRMQGLFGIISFSSFLFSERSS